VNLRPLDPADVERLLALPPDHPDRRRAEASGQLEAWRRMVEAFESTSSGAPAGHAELDRRLAARLEEALGPAPDIAGERAPRATRNTGRRVAWGFALRPAFAILVLGVVAGGWWLTERTRTPHLRAMQDVSAGMSVAVPRAEADGVHLAWSAVTGAQAYRLVFYGPKLDALATLETAGETTFVLRRGALPAGLAPGGEVFLEVTALRHGLAFATSRGRIVRLP
jgi:hypothetical protein